MRDCLNCLHHTERGCTVWECSYIRRAGTQTMTLNKIMTDAEYIADGFRLDEVADARRSDVLQNKYHLEGWTPAEKAEYYALVDKLGI